MNPKLYLLLFLLLSVAGAKAQSPLGLWHGYVTAFGVPDNASYTIDVQSQTGNVITGKAYVTNEKYPVTEGTLDFIGVVEGKSWRITELSIVKSIVGVRRHYLCVKYLNLAMNNKKDKNYLTGLWAGSIYDGSNCVPGEVYLQRVTAASDSIPMIIKASMAANKTSKMTFMDTELTKPIIIDVYSRNIQIELRDYLREDNDTVSVYYNRKLIIDRLRIAKKAKSYRLRLERQSGLNELIIYANNLGMVPPNTSTLLVRDNQGLVQRVKIESTKQTSAVIYLRYVERNQYYNYYRNPSDVIPTYRGGGTASF